MVCTCTVVYWCNFQDLETHKSTCWRAGNLSVNWCSMPMFMWASSMDWVRHPLDCQWASRKAISNDVFLTFPYPLHWPVPPFHPTLMFPLMVSQVLSVPHVPTLPTSHRFTTFFHSPQVQVCSPVLLPRLVLYSLFIGGLAGCWQEMRACLVCPPFSHYHHKLYSLVLLLVPAASHIHHPIQQSQLPWTHIVRVKKIMEHGTLSGISSSPPHQSHHPACLGPWILAATLNTPFCHC